MFYLTDQEFDELYQATITGDYIKQMFVLQKISMRKTEKQQKKQEAKKCQKQNYKKQ